ncbi:MAG TPA: DUF2752 domain-containing protein [Thermoanaerobaculia bacterium]|nr:DUF2752 domain-containing protein [Thermoanaerobaculia bacterium]
MAPGRQLAFLWGGAALVGAAGAPWAPAFARGLPPCPFRALLGIPCLTCGSTRALVDLSRLDVGGAFSWNPLAAAAGILFVLGGLAALGAALSGRGVEAPRPTSALRAVLVLALAANWVFLIAAGR